MAGDVSAVPVHWTVGAASVLDQQTHQCHLVPGESGLHSVCVFAVSVFLLGYSIGRFE